MPAYYNSGALNNYTSATTSGTAGASNWNYVNSATTCSSMYNEQMYYYRTASRTECAAHYDRAAAQDRQQREFDAKHKAATLRSYLLLRRQLTAEQWRTFRKNKWFVVQGGKTGKRYRIRANGSLVANVEVMADNDNEVVAYKLCAHPAVATVPTGDHLLSQKIMLEWAEEEFLSRANRHAA